MKIQHYVYIGASGLLMALAITRWYPDNAEMLMILACIAYLGWLERTIALIRLQNRKA